MGIERGNRWIKISIKSLSVLSFFYFACLGEKNSKPSEIQHTEYAHKQLECEEGREQLGKNLVFVVKCPKTGQIFCELSWF